MKPLAFAAFLLCYKADGGGGWIGLQGGAPVPAAGGDLPDEQAEDNKGDEEHAHGQGDNAASVAPGGGQHGKLPP